MTILEDKPALPSLDYGICDGDQHYYEVADATTRHLPREFKNVMKWIEMDGVKKLVVNGKLLMVVPNPTYDPVGVPGSLETYFRSVNVNGIELRDMVKMQPIQDAYTTRDARIKELDRQQVELAWLLPSLGLGLEELLVDDPDALYAVTESYNRWLADDWGYNRDGRIQTGPLIPLVDPVRAEKELDRVIAAGARFVTMRPGSVGGYPGNFGRSIADPAHDRVFAKIADAGIVLAFHAADSGYNRQLADWGEGLRYTGMKGSTFGEVLGISIDRPIFETIAAMICHGAFDRHPKLKVATLELGAGWVHYLFHRLRVSYGKTPQKYGMDPIEQFRRNVWVAPFYEDDVVEVAKLIGADRILLGSDFPHPEGLAEPRAWVGDYMGLSEADRKLALHSNLKGLAGL